MTSEKWWSILRGAGLAGFGAAIAVFLNAASSGALGTWSPLVGALASVLANLMRKWAEPAT